MLTALPSTTDSPVTSLPLFSCSWGEAPQHWFLPSCPPALLHLPLAGRSALLRLSPSQMEILMSGAGRGLASDLQHISTELEKEYRSSQVSRGSEALTASTQLPLGCPRVICGNIALKSEAMLLEPSEEKVHAAQYLGRRP